MADTFPSALYKVNCTNNCKWQRNSPGPSASPCNNWTSERQVVHLHFAWLHLADENCEGCAEGLQSTSYFPQKMQVWHSLSLSTDMQYRYSAWLGPLAKKFLSMQTQAYYQGLCERQDCKGETSDSRRQRPPTTSTSQLTAVWSLSAALLQRRKHCTKV